MSKRSLELGRGVLTAFTDDVVVRSTHGLQLDGVASFLPYITPFVPTERGVYLHLPLPVYVDAQGREMVGLAGDIEEVGALTDVAEDELVVALDECTSYCTGGGEGE